MPKNIEIKATIRNYAAVKTRIQQLCPAQPALLRQKDTYFRIRNARLKLRETPAAAELIYYRRNTEKGPKLSRYIRKKILFPAILRNFLALLLGVRGVVEKERLLFFHGRTRIHLDTVRTLGQFVEFEVVLGDSDPPASGQAEAEMLMNQLNLSLADLVAASYIDLLEDVGAKVHCAP